MTSMPDREPDADRRDFERVKARAVAAVAHWIEVANRHGREHARPSVPLPRVDFDLRGKTAGMAVVPRTGVVARLRVNVDLLARYPVRIIQQTVPHEVAHIVQRAWWPRSRPHGPEWQSLMHLFGKPADRCHDMVVQRTRAAYQYRCACPDRILELGAQRHRKLQKNSAIYRCRACRSTLTFVGASRSGDQ